MKSLAFALGASAIALVASTSATLAGPITSATFSTSVGKQPTNVGTITLTQIDADSVSVFVDLINTAIPNSSKGYGFLNTGGPHTPFAFTLAGSEVGLSINPFTTPANGIGPYGTFTLNTAGGDNTPYGTYGVAIDYVGDHNNGSGKAYYGDLLFTLNRTGGLTIEDFITNGPNGTGYYFSADLTDGLNTGAQAWASRTLTREEDPPVEDPPTKVPEPFTMSLFAVGLAGVAGLRRRKSSTNSGAAAA